MTNKSAIDDFATEELLEEEQRGFDQPEPEEQHYQHQDDQPQKKKTNWKILAIPAAFILLVGAIGLSKMAGNNANSPSRSNQIESDAPASTTPESHASKDPKPDVAIDAAANQPQVAVQGPAIPSGAQAVQAEPPQQGGQAGAPVLGAVHPAVDPNQPQMGAQVPPQMPAVQGPAPAQVAMNTPAQQMPQPRLVGPAPAPAQGQAPAVINQASAATTPALVQPQGPNLQPVPAAQVVQAPVDSRAVSATTGLRSSDSEYKASIMGLKQQRQQIDELIKKEESQRHLLAKQTAQAQAKPVDPSERRRSDGQEVSKKLSKAPTKEASAKVSASTVVRGDYTVSAVVDDRAWIQSATGEPHTVAVGERLPDGSLVKDVNQNGSKLEVITSTGRIIQEDRSKASSRN